MKKEFFSRSGEFNVLHIAGHAVEDSVWPNFSRIILSGEPDGGDDRNIRAFELRYLRTGARLVVLSGCATMWDRKLKSLNGFSSALVFAGVPSIVGSLWQVNDESTAELMASFYKYLERGERVSRALQVAKIDMIRSGKSDPYYWAAFVLLGDTSPVKIVRDDNRVLWLYAIGIVSLLMFTSVVAQSARLNKGIRFSNGRFAEARRRKAEMGDRENWGDG